MKQMRYKKSSEHIVLLYGYYKGFCFYIISYGTHPCAYVNIPKGHTLNFNDIICPGGITYSENYLYTGKDVKVDGWWIGWDYAHIGDYFPLIAESGRKWRTEEIEKHVLDVIDQLNKLLNL